MAVVLIDIKAGSEMALPFWVSPTYSGLAFAKSCVTYYLT